MGEREWEIGAVGGRVGDPNFPPDLAIHPSRPATTGTDNDDDAAADQQLQNIPLYGLAGRTWEAARSLHRYLAAHPAFFPPASTLLELGSGTGYLGLHLAALLDAASTVLLTDLENVVPLLMQNIAAFRFPVASCDRAQILALPLPWGSASHLARILEHHQPTHILASDLIYFPELYPLLLRSLTALTATATPAPPILFGYKSRTLVREESFWRVFGTWFEFHVLQRGDATDADEVWLFWCRRRPETQRWKVPQDDRALMSGFYEGDGEEMPATGGSEQFELLLFSGLEVA